MKTTILVLSLLVVPLISWATSAPAKTVTYEYDTGPLPPEYHGHSNTVILVDDAKQILDVTKEIQKGYGEGKKTILKGELGSEWYVELDKILKSVPSCKQDRGRLIGGPTKTMTVKDGGKEFQIKWQDICDKDKSWWDKWETFAGEASQAIEKMTTKKEGKPISYIKMNNGAVVAEITIKPDDVTRTGKVYLNGTFKRDLNVEELRKLRDLVSAPNYYNDGRVNDPKAQKNGEFIDRGEGSYFSFEKGLADPMGKSNTREALTKYFEQFAGGVDLYKNTGKIVTVNGKVSQIMWQHIMQPTKEYQNITYLDFDKQQTVVYSKEPIKCKGMVEVTGRVIKVEGNSKDPRRKEAVDEYHIQAEKWSCKD